MRKLLIILLILLLPSNVFAHNNCIAPDGYEHTQMFSDVPVNSNRIFDGYNAKWTAYVSNHLTVIASGNDLGGATTYELYKDAYGWDDICGSDSNVHIVYYDAGAQTAIIQILYGIVGATPTPTPTPTPTGTGTATPTATPTSTPGQGFEEGTPAPTSTPNYGNNPGFGNGSYSGNNTGFVDNGLEEGNGFAITLTALGYCRNQNCQMTDVVDASYDFSLGLLIMSFLVLLLKCYLILFPGKKKSKGRRRR